MNYTLYHGDCLDILPTLDAGSVDAVICDPPYGTTACKWDSVIPFEPMWAALKRLIKPRGAIVLFGSQPFTSALAMSNPKWFRYEIIWEKDNSNNFLATNWQPLKRHENILLFSERQPVYYPQRTPAKPYKAGAAYTAPVKSNKTGADFKMRPAKEYTEGRHPLSVVFFPREYGVHPTQKPLALLEYLVKTYTSEDDTVLDFTMGGGTTGHACANTGRRFIGIEKDTEYFKIAQERIATAYEPLRSMQVAI